MTSSPASCVCSCVLMIVLVTATVHGGPTVSSQAPRDPGNNEPCQPDKLTVYKVVLHTFWSRETFPKHYPDWRPPAQWSKVFGKLNLKNNIKSITIFKISCFNSFINILNYLKINNSQLSAVHSRRWVSILGYLIYSKLEKNKLLVNLPSFSIFVLLYQYFFHINVLLSIFIYLVA